MAGSGDAHASHGVWTLLFQRFKRHRLAVAGAGVLAFLSSPCSAPPPKASTC